MAAPKKNVLGRVVSPLRYPGSKRRLIGYVEHSLLLNNLRPKLYVESFVGGASIALQLMADDLVEKVILIDLDPLITAFWKTVFYDTEWLTKQISKADVSLERWRYYKKLKPNTTREHALKCLFLNRTSFSGILQPGAGPIGGLEQSSEYTIDCRFPKKTLIRRIERISQLKNKVYAIWNASWKKGLSNVINHQNNGKLPKEDVFFYFDPPFINKADRLYRFFFTEKDHKELRDCLLNLDMPWMLSYDSASEVETLYKTALENKSNTAKREDVEILYSIAATGLRKSSEIVLSNLAKMPAGQSLWTQQKRPVVSHPGLMAKPVIALDTPAVS